MCIIMMQKGIDISTFQRGIDLEERVNKGDRFVIIRSSYDNKKDVEFDKHYKNACDACLFIGAYHYAYATTPKEAETEANTMVKALKDKVLHMPVFYDLEDKTLAKLSPKEIEAIYLAWEKILNQHGYKTGVYANADWYRNKLTDNVKKRAVKWVALWGNEPPFPWDIWQYTSSNGKLDCNKVHDYYLQYLMKGGYYF